MTSLLHAMTAVLLLGACATIAEPQEPADRADAAAIEVMILGSWHFETQDSNMIDVAGPDVLTPGRQAELEGIVDDLMAFDPTVIAVEVQAPAPGFVDPGYKDYTPARLAETPNEVVQIGYRLAARAGLEAVHGIDEQPGEGEPDYFPAGKLMAHAGSTGRGEEIQARLAMMEADVTAIMAGLDDMPLADALLVANDGALASPDLYYELLDYDLGEDQPAAELYAYYMMRNAKIFSKLLDIAEPGDRVVVVYGAGHKHFLDHLAEHMPGVRVVQPRDYLD
jgi:hypothetical protein